MQAQKGDGCSKSDEETTPEAMGTIGADLFDVANNPDTLDLPLQSAEVDSADVGGEAAQANEVPIPSNQDFDKNIFDPFLPDFNTEIAEPISNEDALNFCGWDSNALNLPEEFTVDARGLVDPSCNLILW